MDIDQIEAAENFDRSIAEEALDNFFAARLGSPMGTLDSVVPGVIAIPRLSTWDDPKIMWEEVAAHLAVETGVGVVCIANCDWQNVDDCDEEATLIAFDIPSLDPDYRDDGRNLIEPVSPKDAPSPDDFARFREACTILRHRETELRGRCGYLRTGGEPRAAAEAELKQTQTLREKLTARHREAVARVLAHDFTSAPLAQPELEDADAAPGPRP